MINGLAFYSAHACLVNTCSWEREWLFGVCLRVYMRVFPYRFDLCSYVDAKTCSSLTICAGVTLPLTLTVFFYSWFVQIARVMPWVHSNLAYYMWRVISWLCLLEHIHTITCDVMCSHQIFIKILFQKLVFVHCRRFLVGISGSKQANEYSRLDEIIDAWIL